MEERREREEWMGKWMRCGKGYTAGGADEGMKMGGGKPIGVYIICTVILKAKGDSMIHGLHTVLFIMQQSTAT